MWSAPFRSFSSSPAASSKTVLVVGGSGALGKSVVDVFKAAGWHTASADVVSNPSADVDVTLPGDGWAAQAAAVSAAVDSVDAVVCTAGGWAGGDVSDGGVFDSVTQMHNVCLMPAVLAAHLSGTLGKGAGLLVFTGSSAALEPTPFMIGYGLAKTATHYLVTSLGSDGGLEGTTVAGVLPATIDTSTNRKFMADQDFSTWTPPEDIANKVLEWTSAPPATGSLYTVSTAGGESTFTIVE